MKKSIFALIIAVVFVSGTIVGAIPFATAVSGGGNPDRPIINQLNAIGKILTKLDQRLERVLAGMGDPDTTPPDPATQNALIAIRNTANTIITRVDQKLPTPVPTPPPDIG